jgi:hypothetical protein
MQHHYIQAILQLDRMGRVTDWPDVINSQLLELRVLSGEIISFVIVSSLPTSFTDECLSHIAYASSDVMQVGAGVRVCLII